MEGDLRDMEKESIPKPGVGLRERERDREGGALAHKAMTQDYEGPTLSRLFFCY